MLFTLVKILYTITRTCIVSVSCHVCTTYCYA